ncbi:MAG TPA: cell division protein SepF [Pseudonocardiaceae bacterium]|jgi:cell division inhibitor SepF|nr:cell division protein SepF [Pseudonocardiaceae bacterium]
MSALQKLKAYFGMVPADEMDEYEDDDRYGGYSSTYSPGPAEDFDGYGDRAAGRRRLGDGARPVSRLDSSDELRSFSAGTGPRGARPWLTETSQRTVTPVRGALAEQPQVEPAPRTRPQPETAAHPLSKITTLHPRSYEDARTIGEQYRDGNPVIINLTALSDAHARRVVDFAAGLAFALHGDIDKVTDKVFLISPPDVDLTAEDHRRIAEGGFFG